MSDAPTSYRIDAAALEEIKRRSNLVGLVEKHVTLRRTGTTFSGPCPFCGGKKGGSRFEVKPAQQVWVCAVCQDGGDCIKFVMKIEGIGFREAIEWLGGPKELSEAARKKLEQQAAARDREQLKRDEKSIARAREIWDAAVPLRPSLGEAYFAARGIGFDGDERAHSLRFQPALDYYWNPPAAKPFVIHTGPALIAALAQADDTISGVHCTYLNAAGDAKLALPDREGEAVKAKKIRGVAKGAVIRLTPSAPLLVIGEGIETTRSVLLALRATGREVAAWAGVSLGNMAGASLGKGYRHPDKPNIWVPDWHPDMERPGLLPPDWASDVVLLGDGDSDALMTRARLDCAAARFTAAGKRVRIAMAAPGKDFNDMVRA